MDLSQLIARVGGEFIVCGDFNTQIVHDSLQRFLESHNLIDLVGTTAELTGMDDMPSTYRRGRNVIDYAFGTEHVYSSIKSVGLASYSDGIKPSDHRAVVVDFHEATLFGDSRPIPPTRPPRGLSTRNDKLCSRFQ
ncbi:MAG: endonuclease/exonuclease/phosphatase family protein, partial [Planctomycetota bacterium]